MSQDDERERGMDGLVGTCPDMCPVKERTIRERLEDVSIFEKGGQFVTKFSRSLTGDPTLIRPFPVLSRSLSYVLRALDSSHEWATIHEFVSDRLRAIRQELSMQRIGGAKAALLYGPMVRFHILSCHELCLPSATLPSNSPSPSSAVDPHPNRQQLSNTLASLLEIFSFMPDSAEEGEFWGYSILLNLGSPALALSLAKVRPSTLHTPHLQRARQALRYYAVGNYVAFCRLFTEATFLEAALLQLHLDEVRERALRVINQCGFKAHPFPLRDLVTLLCFQDEVEVGALCHRFGLAVGMDAGGREPCLLLKETKFKTGVEEAPGVQSPIVVRKRMQSRLGTVLAHNKVCRKVDLESDKMTYSIAESTIYKMKSTS